MKNVCLLSQVTHTYFLDVHRPNCIEINLKISQSSPDSLLSVLWQQVY